MKRSIGIWQLSGFAFTSLFGTFLHFLYDLSGKSSLTAPISATNESTWEHMKILFFPMLVFAVFESFFFKEYKDFWCIKLKGILLGLILIPTLFYTYNGVFGNSSATVNVLIFFISAAITYITETVSLKKQNDSCRTPKFAFVILLLVLSAFVIFTFYPPNIPLFADPTSVIPKA